MRQRLNALPKSQQARAKADMQGVS
jgi:hypothetical protein